MGLMDVKYSNINSGMANKNTSIWSKLKVVLWKSFVIRKHHWFLTLCEIAIPIVLFVLIAYARAKIGNLGKEYIPYPSYNTEISSSDFYNNRFNHETQIYYTPNTEFTSALIYKVQLKLELNSKAVRGFDSELDLIGHYESFGHNETIMAVVFNISNNEIPKHLKYAIRPFEKFVDWETQSLFNYMHSYIPDFGSVTYINKGFIAMQMALDTSFIEMSTNSEMPVSVYMQEFPYPPYRNDVGATDLFLYVLPLITIFSFVFLCPAVLKRIVEEKSTGIKELMKMMGLKSWMLWLGWFLHAFVVNCISIFIITFFMKVQLWDAQYPPIEYCSWSLFLAFLILYCAAGITFCFAISSFFNRPTLAMVVGILAWLLSNIISNSLVEQSPNMRWGNKVLFGIFPNMALSYGYKAISVYETREVGANWSNLFNSAGGGSEDVTMGNVLIMFLVDIIIYMLITLYVENIKPGPYGLAKPFHFPVSYLWNIILKRTSKVNDDEEESVSKKYCKIEPAPDMATGIQVKNLHKKFGKQAAVNGLSIDIYEGQITALLGHNGAGKTTTMSIITGMIGASSGKVLINDKDIKYNINGMRSSLGLCPQHNLQFTDLTVLEHLIFFGMLKGLSKKEAEEQANHWLMRMNLSFKKHSLASNLSGGMRRKLSLAIALIGNSKVLILDEPTSGLDPEARREIWDMLLTLRGSRTILITTHFMEEADVLGDRIAIMDHGRLICYGTSMFLKKEYGAGYHLTVIRDEVIFQSMKENLGRDQVQDITQIVMSEIKTAVLQSNTGHHLTYLLPHEAKPCFSNLLAKLEEKKENLGITNIGMSVTTLEEVFLRVGNMVAKEDRRDKAKDRHSLDSNGTVRSMDSSDSTDSVGSTTSIKSTGGEKVTLQLRSLFKKRWYVFKKKWLVFLMQVCIALLITIKTLYLGEAVNSPMSENFAKFDFDLSKYGDTKVFYGGPNHDSELAKMEQQYDKLVLAQQGDPQKVSGVSDAIIKAGEENIEFYKQHMIVATEFNVTNGKRSVNAMYANRAVHGAPISLNLLMNAILKGIMGDGYAISATNSPLPVKEESSLGEASEMQVATLWFILFPLGMLFLAGTFVLFPQMERTSNIKQLQLMCGIRSGFYWGMCYVYDFLLYATAVGIILFVIAIYGCIYSSTFSGEAEIGALLAILASYGLSIIPYSYLFSYTKTAAGGFASFLISSLFVSVVMTIVVVVLEMSGEEYYENIGEILKYCLLLFPQFGLTYTSLQFSRKAVWNHNWDIKPPEHKKAKCHFDYNPCCSGSSTSECQKFRSYFSGPGSIRVNVLEMAVSTIIYFAILLLLENDFVQRCRDKFLIFVYNKMHSEKSKMDVTDSVNTDVKIETERVYKTLEREKRPQTGNSEGDDLLLVHNLEKIYWGQKVVKGISFGVKAGDCFGLLGVNGAGKTTTFRMLTGDEPLTTGNARILIPSKHNTVSISNDSKEYLEKVGYCPQFDAINEVLTGREMLRLFAELRGISDGVEQEVNRWLKALGLEEYADKLCGEYSGGNKRKLSMAIALIGSPLLVMLDEPTSGVDPVSRRRLWDTLTAIQRQREKPSILLTSHSMEECEALCNKLAIMKAGQLECYGTIPKLKEDYGQGFTVMLKLKPALLTVTVNSMDDDESTASQSQPLSGSNRNNKTLSKSKGLDIPEIIEDPEEVKSLMAAFEGKYKGFCTLKDKHSGLLHYHINDKNKGWSKLFKEIEDFKQDHSIIEDYNISETTLEEVFLSIARSDVKK